MNQRSSEVHKQFLDDPDIYISKIRDQGGLYWEEEFQRFISDIDTPKVKILNKGCDRTVWIHESIPNIVFKKSNHSSNYQNIQELILWFIAGPTLRKYLADVYYCSDECDILIMSRHDPEGANKASNLSADYLEQYVQDNIRDIYIAMRKDGIVIYDLHPSNVCIKSMRIVDYANWLPD